MVTEFLIGWQFPLLSDFLEYPTSTRAYSDEEISTDYYRHLSQIYGNLVIIPPFSIDDLILLIDVFQYHQVWGRI